MERNLKNPFRFLVILIIHFKGIIIDSRRPNSDSPLRKPPAKTGCRSELVLAKINFAYVLIYSLN